ncbi:MAG: hypothetical protein ABI619_12000 [Betaproteobacteria bacterium]
MTQSPPNFDAAPWHALLAPLPADAVPLRKPVASPEILAKPEGATIAGWEQLTINLSAGAAGLRNVLVVLDANGRVIAANDSVLFCTEVTGPRTGSDTEYRQESVGGRFEEDGSFRGTRWHSVTAITEPAPEDEPRIVSTRAEPSAAEVADLRALVAEVMRRAGLPR